MNLRCVIKKDLLQHLLITSLCMGFVYWRFQSLNLALLCLLSGVFIDLDHLIDHFLYFGAKFRWSDFFNSEALKSGKVYLILHSWELLVLLWIWYIISGKSIPTLVISLGFLSHLWIDQRQRTQALAYFSIFRAFHKFRVDKIVPEMLLNST